MRMHSAPSDVFRRYLLHHEQCEPYKAESVAEVFGHKPYADYIYVVGLE